MHRLALFARSIAGRLTLASLVFLPLLIVATGFALDRAFRQSLLQAEEQQLTTWVYLLLGAAETDEGQLVLPNALTEPRLSQAGSGLYAFVHAERDNRMSPDDLIWQSPSSRWLALPSVGLDRPRQLAPLVSHFERSSPEYFSLRYRVQWELDGADDLNLVFSLYHAADEFEQQRTAFSQSLWRWLSGVAVLMMLGQWLLLYWALGPLRRVSDNLQQLHSGEVAEVTGEFVRELQPLVDNLNALLRAEKLGRERYRNALADLAHSVKTPLAVVRNELHQAKPDDTLLMDQIQRLEDIVARQLARASVAHGAIASLQDAMPVARRLAASLKKLYPGVAFHLSDQKFALPVDEKDLFDLLGNLMENACKYGAQNVAVTGSAGQHRGERYRELKVEDDGPGMPESARQAVVARGKRADEQAAGQGLGLALVQDIVLAHGGELLLEASDAGGLSARCRFPEK